MTGRLEPTQDDLLKNLIDCVLAIPPPALSKRYNREGVNKILDYLGMNSHEASAVLGGVKPTTKIAKPSGTGHSGSSHTHASSNSTSAASINLAIQLVLFLLCYISYTNGLEDRTSDVGILPMIKIRDIEYLQRYGQSYDWHTTSCIPRSHRFRICGSLGRRRRLPRCGRKLREFRKNKTKSSFSRQALCRGTMFSSGTRQAAHLQSLIKRGRFNMAPGLSMVRWYRTWSPPGVFDSHP